MLIISPEQIRFIIVKAREFDEKVVPSGRDSEDDPRIILEYPDDATLSELQSVIDSLNEDEQLAFVGFIILLSLAFGLLVHFYWFAVTGFVGLNMLQAAFTGFCPLAIMLKKPALNRAKHLNMRLTCW